MRNCFAANEESRAITARKMKETADVIVFVECAKETLCLFDGVREGREGNGVAKACGQAGVAIDNLAEALHRRECNAHPWGEGRARINEGTAAREGSKKKSRGRG